MMRQYFTTSRTPQLKKERETPTPLPIILANLISNKTVAEASPLPFLF